MRWNVWIGLGCIMFFLLLGVYQNLHISLDMGKDVLKSEGKEAQTATKSIPEWVWGVIAGIIISTYSELLKLVIKLLGLGGK